MNRELLTATTKVLKANTEDLFAMASSKGIQMPHPALTVWSCLLAEIEVANENGVRLGKKATLEAVDTAIGCQINWGHLGKGYACGHIINAEIRDKKDIWITCIGFKEMYEDEFKEAEDLMKQGKLAMSFEISAGVDTQDKLPDSTRRVNDYYFTGAGLLLGVAPACTKAYVSEMAQKIDAERRELVVAKKSTKSIIDSIIKVVGEMRRINANYKCECTKCGKIVSTAEHCKDIKCPECGGDMRREDRPSKNNVQNNKGESKVKLDEIKATLTAEFGEEIVADWTDEDFQNEEKVTEARQAKEAKIEADKVEAEKVAKEEAEKVEADKVAKEKADKVIEEESTSKSKTVIKDDGSDVTTEESVYVTRVDSKEVYRRKSNNEYMYAEADYSVLQAKIEELESALTSKDSEIEEVRANAQEIAKLKIEHKDNEFTAEFKDEDWLQAEKIQEAVTKKETAELIAKNKEDLKENEFATDFSDEDYANETKVELAKIKAENKVLKDKVPAEPEEKVEANKEEDLDTGEDVKRESEFAHITNPITRAIMIEKKAKKEKLKAREEKFK